MIIVGPFPVTTKISQMSRFRPSKQRPAISGQMSTPPSSPQKRSLSPSALNAHTGLATPTTQRVHNDQGPKVQSPSSQLTPAQRQKHTELIQAGLRPTKVEESSSQKHAESHSAPSVAGSSIRLAMIQAALRESGSSSQSSSNPSEHSDAPSPQKRSRLQNDHSDRGEHTSRGPNPASATAVVTAADARIKTIEDEDEEAFWLSEPSESVSSTLFPAGRASSNRLPDVAGQQQRAPHTPSPRPKQSCESTPSIDYVHSMLSTPPETVSQPKVRKDIPLGRLGSAKSLDSPSKSIMKDVDASRAGWERISADQVVFRSILKPPFFSDTLN